MVEFSFPKMSGRGGHFFVGIGFVGLLWLWKNCPFHGFPVHVFVLACFGLCLVVGVFFLLFFGGFQSFCDFPKGFC